MRKWINKKFIKILLDLTKGFDKVDHAMFMYKLETIGTRSIGLNFFKSYVNNGKKFQ